MGTRNLFATLLFVVVGLFALTGTAYAAPLTAPSARPAASQPLVKPNFSASGGGCNSTTDNYAPGGSVKLSGCISGRGDLFGWSVAPDSYASFTSPTAGWSSCTITLKLWDYTLGTNPETQSFGCTADANASHKNVHYTLASYSNGSACPQDFQTSIAIQGIFAGTVVSTYVYSPTEQINC